MRSSSSRGKSPITSFVKKMRNYKRGKSKTKTPKNISNLTSLKMGSKSPMGRFKGWGIKDSSPMTMRNLYLGKANN